MPRASKSSGRSRAKRASKQASKKRPKARARKTSKRRASAAPAPSSPRYVRDLLVRGEAVQPGPGGKLPPGATHVIERTAPDGSATVRRVRFTIS
jgi:hypothetical protein